MNPVRRGKRAGRLKKGNNDCSKWLNYKKKKNHIYFNVLRARESPAEQTETVSAKAAERRFRVVSAASPHLHFSAVRLVATFRVLRDTATHLRGRGAATGHHKTTQWASDVPFPSSDSAEIQAIYAQRANKSCDYIHYRLHASLTKLCSGIKAEKQKKKRLHLVTSKFLTLPSWKPRRLLRSPREGRLIAVHLVAKKKQQPYGTMKSNE